MNVTLAEAGPPIDRSAEHAGSEQHRRDDERLAQQDSWRIACRWRSGGTMSTVGSGRAALPASDESVGRQGWLAVCRVAYAAGTLLLWRPRDATVLASLPDELYFAPLGPFALLRGWPPAWVFNGLQAAVVVAAVALLVGWRTRAASITLTVALVVLAGLRFGTGKVDHDLVIHLVPALLASSWGARLAIRPEPAGRPRVGWLAIVLGVTFLTSGLAKATTGWLDPSYSATAGWLQTYADQYGRGGPLAASALGADSMPWELIDWITVTVEVGLLPLLLWRRTVPVAVAGAAVFNIGVVALFSIDFAQFVVVYLPLLSLVVQVPRRVPAWVAAPVFMAVGAVLYVGLPGGPWRALVPYVLLGGVATVGLVVAARSREGGWSVRPRLALIAAAVLLAPFPLTYVVTEPYPAVIGPLFRGDGYDGLRQEWAVAGDVVRPRAVFGAPAPYSTNLGLVGWPPPSGQGHELKRAWYHPRPVLPDDVEVRWVPADP
jgi:hypothetical protein